MLTAAFLCFFTWWLGADVRQILAAVAVATTGEVILSIGWELYSYRHAVIPPYVPPGHGVFYLLAFVSAEQEWFRRHEAAITRFVLVAGSVVAVASLVAMNDQWGFLWWLGALALMARSKSRLLLATCFVYTMLLEWIGTANGNWLWAAEVPGLGLSSANPPAGAGILYIILDLTVVAITSRVRTPAVEHV